MSRCFIRILLLYVLLLTALADDWTKPKANTSTLVIVDRMAVDEEEVLRKEIRRIFPIIANVSVGTKKNGNIIGFQLRQDGLSVSHSKTRTAPDENGTQITKSRSATFAAGIDGIAGALAQVLGYNDPKLANKTDVKVKTFSRGNASANSYTVLEGGFPGSGVNSQVGKTGTGANSGRRSDVLPED